MGIGLSLVKMPKKITAHSSLNGDGCVLAMMSREH